jgi:hypothetical protein
MATRFVKFVTVDTDHYRVTKQFLAAPERYFRHLLSDEADDDGEV